MIDEAEQAALDKIERQLRAQGLSEADITACLAVVLACVYEKRRSDPTNER